MRRGGRIGTVEPPDLRSADATYPETATAGGPTRSSGNAAGSPRHLHFQITTTPHQGLGLRGRRDMIKGVCQRVAEPTCSALARSSLIH
jgi:hypothetical protein